MNIERLQVLSAHLKSLSASQFDLRSWTKVNDRDIYQDEDKFLEQYATQVVVRGAGENPVHVAEVDGKLVLGHCGTTACAVGHACTIPEFNAQGLRLSVNLGVDKYCGNYASFEPIYDDGEERQSSWGAVEVFFGLSEREAKWLFLDDYYRVPTDSDWHPRAKATPAMVAQRIDALIANPELELSSLFACEGAEEQ